MAGDETGQADPTKGRLLTLVVQLGDDPAAAQVHGGEEEEDVEEGDAGGWEVGVGLLRDSQGRRVEATEAPHGYDAGLGRGKNVSTHVSPRSRRFSLPLSGIALYDM